MSSMFSSCWARGGITEDLVLIKQWEVMAVDAAACACWTMLLFWTRKNSIACRLRSLTLIGWRESEVLPTKIVPPPISTVVVSPQRRIPQTLSGPDAQLDHASHQRQGSGAPRHRVVAPGRSQCVFYNSLRWQCKKHLLALRSDRPPFTPPYLEACTFAPSGRLSSC